MKSPTLIGNQIKHSNKILKHLGKFGRAIDCSPTGSGKTYIASFVAFTLLNASDTSEKIEAVHIICPPSLKSNWVDVFHSFNLPITFIHGYNVFHYPHHPNSLVICDEFHYLKNKSLRYERMLNLAKETKYMLCLSATPIDNKIQYWHYRRMLGVSIFRVKSRCDYASTAEQSIKFISSPNKDEEKLAVYCSGYDEIRSCFTKMVNNRKVFSSGKYVKGLMMLHESIIDDMVKLSLDVLKEAPNTKLIIIEQYYMYIEVLLKALNSYSPLTLNGKTKNRPEVIAKFQEPSVRHRVLITNASVGGVGLNLDDQVGGFPRTTIISPLGNYCEYKQVIGRTQRRKTVSDSSILIIQPHNSIQHTYMKGIINGKGDVLKTFFSKTVKTNKK